MASQKYPPRDEDGVVEAGEQMAANADLLRNLGFSDADIARLSGALGAARTGLATHKVSQQKARADRSAKDEAIDALADILSEFNRRIQPLKTVDDPMRDKFGIPVYDTTRTQADAPTEMPNVLIDTAMPLRHEIKFSGDTSRGKPDGVRSIEIHVKIGGAATADVDDYQYLTNDTESPYVKDFKSADAGKQAHYLFAWVNTKGERGAWRMASATVTNQLQNDSV